MTTNQSTIISRASCVSPSHDNHDHHDHGSSAYDTSYGRFDPNYDPNYSPPPPDSFQGRLGDELHGKHLLVPPRPPNTPDDEELAYGPEAKRLRMNRVSNQVVEDDDGREARVKKEADQGMSNQIDGQDDGRVSDPAADGKVNEDQANGVVEATQATNQVQFYPDESTGEEDAVDFAMELLTREQSDRDPRDARETDESNGYESQLMNDIPVIYPTVNDGYADSSNAVNSYNSTNVYNYSNIVNQGDQIEEPTINFNVTPHRHTIGITSQPTDVPQTTLICSTLTARPLPTNDTFARSPIDIVVALDVSGSMRVEKLDLCKQTLHLLLRELHHRDRFALISFSDEAKLEVPMGYITEENKLLACHAIDKLAVRGRTNLASAITLAAQVAYSVTIPNKVRSVFLLTDGNANCGYTETKDLLELTSILVQDHYSQNPHSPPITLHTFGYGPEPDGDLLLQMAKVTSGGSFYNVREKSMVASAFGDAIGGILSVVAQNIVLTISVPRELKQVGGWGVKILGVSHESKEEVGRIIEKNDSGGNIGKQGSFANDESTRDGNVDEVGEGTWKVYLGDIYAEESRDVLFEVTLANPPSGVFDSEEEAMQPIPHAVVELSYTDTLHHSTDNGNHSNGRNGDRGYNNGSPSRPTLIQAAYIARPPTNELSWPDPHVAIQRLRVQTIQVIQRTDALAKVGNYAQAKSELVSWMEGFHREAFEIGALGPNGVSDVSYGLNGADRADRCGVGCINQSFEQDSQDNQDCNASSDPLVIQLLEDLTECYDELKKKAENASSVYSPYTPLAPSFPSYSGYAPYSKYSSAYSGINKQSSNNGGTGGNNDRLYKSNEGLSQRMMQTIQMHNMQRCSEPIVSGKRNIYRTGAKSLRASAFHASQSHQATGGEGQGIGQGNQGTGTGGNGQGTTTNRGQGTQRTQGPGCQGMGRGKQIHSLNEGVDGDDGSDGSR